MNKDGEMSHYELLTYFKKLFQRKGLKFSLKDFEKFIKISDTSKDGKLSKNELITIL